MKTTYKSLITAQEVKGHRLASEPYAELLAAKGPGKGRSGGWCQRPGRLNKRHRNTAANARSNSPSLAEVEPVTINCEYRSSSPRPDVIATAYSLANSACDL